MKILHVVPGLNEKWNGIAVAAKLIADGQRKDGHEVDLVDAASFSTSTSNLHLVDEVWVHGMWLPREWCACWKVLRAQKSNHHSTPTPNTYTSRPRLVRMTHANLDPLRYRYHGWKKRLVSSIERWIFSKTDRVVVTGEWEAEWCRQWGLKNEFQIVDLKSFFNLGVVNRCRYRKDGEPLHVLYLGRRHPLKGVQYLEQAVRELNHRSTPTPNAYTSIDLRIESSLFGEAKEAAWEWCDVLCLPTLSENFGLVVGEALERGKPVIVTDGAPAWQPPTLSAEVEKRGGGGEWRDHLVYLRGYREGSDAECVELLKGALCRFLS